MTSEQQIRTVLKVRLNELSSEIEDLDLHLVGATLLVSGVMALVAKNVPLESIQSQLRGIYDQLNTAKTFVDSLIRT